MADKFCLDVVVHVIITAFISTRIVRQMFRIPILTRGLRFLQVESDRHTGANKPVSQSVEGNRAIELSQNAPMGTGIVSGILVYHIHQVGRKGVK